MSRGMYTANSVDVIGADGLLRYGRVVDVAPNGLFIDFLCPGRRRELTPFANVYLLRDLATAKTFEPIGGKQLAKAIRQPHTAAPWQVLARESTSGPFAWFPAVLVNTTRGVKHSRLGAAIVQYWNSGPSTEIVEPHRLRRGDWWALTNRPVPAQILFPGGWSYHHDALSAGVRPPTPVVQGMFAKRRIWLPDDAVGLSAKQLVVILEDAHLFDPVFMDRVTFVDSTDGHAGFVLPCPTNDKSLPDRIVDYLRHLVLSNVHSFCEPLPSPPRVREVEYGMGLLPSEVLSDIFSHLDTVTQTNFRSVCSLWNSLLLSPATTSTIVIHCVHNEGPESNQSLYLSTSPIIKCLRPSTKHIIVTSRELVFHSSDFWKVLDVIDWLVKQNPGIRLKSLYCVGLGGPLGIVSKGSTGCPLHRSPSTSSLNRYGLLGGFIAALRSVPCDSIHLINTELFLYCSPWESYDDWLRADKHALHLGTLKLTGGDGGEFWDALEKALPKPTSEELKNVSRYLVMGAAEYDDCCMVLCATQTADPRTSLAYRGKQWCVDGMEEVRLDRLSPIALHFLTKLANGEFFKDLG